VSTSAPAASPVPARTEAPPLLSGSDHAPRESFVLVSGDFVTSGGMDRANYALADYLARAGATVHLVAHRVAPELLARPNATFHRVPKPLNSYLLGAPLLDRAGRRVAAQVSRAGGRVVVNGGNCRWNDVNWVHYVHAAYEPVLPPGTGWATRLRHAYARRKSLADERRGLREARIVIANSQRTRSDLIERLGIGPERVKTIYYGVDSSRFHAIDEQQRQAIRAAQGWPSDRPLVAFVGALSDERKGADVVLSAWRLLCRDRDWDAVLLVFGEGAQLPAMRRAIEHEGLGQRVRFLGFRSDLPNVLCACDALVSPVRYEAFGLGVLEALACAMPAIVSADAGAAELYPTDLKHLLLPDPNDATDLAQRLKRWREGGARDRPGLLAFSDSLRAHSWDQMCRQFLDAIADSSTCAASASASAGARDAVAAAVNES
jgi:glycosyltransferase involved in cell wall biosynthesis